MYHFRVNLQLQPRVFDAVSLALKMETLPGTDGITLDMLKKGDEIMNISMGIRKCVCQTKNMVREVNKVIDNIATQLSKKGSFCLRRRRRNFICQWHVQLHSVGAV